jgi:hypothetical protein
MKPGTTPADLHRIPDATKETYGAALQQFDELLLAASTVSPISRPLPLYYAVLQAGKALAAALAPGDWSKIGHGHGLGEDQEGRTVEVAGQHPCVPGRPEGHRDLRRSRERIRLWKADWQR